MSLLTIILVAISLSMDAFSLALIYGTLSIAPSVILKMSVVVGVFHFFMPLFGFFFGDLLSFFLHFNAEYLVGIIFIILSLQMILSVFKQENVEVLSGLLSYFLFGFTVSVDSFSVGIGIGSLGGSIFLPCIIFSLVSALFTYVGLRLGNQLASKFGTLSTIFGSITLFLLGLHHLL